MSIRRVIVEAARSCVGTAFRPQGRLLGQGLDCVGVVLVAARAAGIAWPEVPAYRLGGEHGAVLERAFAALGCVPVDVPQWGDVVVLAPLPRQRHLGVLTPAGLVHAHAGLGRVVEGPMDPAWRVMGHWRLAGVD